MTNTGLRVGIMSPGDMGSGWGAVLHAHGVEVYTCLAGRSDLTRLRAQEAGFKDSPDLDHLVSNVDLLLSILVPAEARRLADEVAAAMKRTGATPVYADLNAIAPKTVLEIEEVIHDAGASFIDGGIIGGSPREGYSPQVAVSGPDTSAMEALRDHELNVRVIGPDIGQASGLKMVYAASTKGATALWTQLMTAARALGLLDALQDQYSERPAVLQAQQRAISGMPHRARRWVGELEEIAKTFEDIGMSPRMLLGAADMCTLVGETPLGDLTPRDPDPPLEEVLDTLVARLHG